MKFDNNSLKFLFSLLPLIVQGSDASPSCVFSHLTSRIHSAALFESHKSQILNYFKEEEIQDFCDFAYRHGKSYKNIEELILRMNILRENEQTVVKTLNSQDDSALYSAFHSPFGDITTDEFKTKFNLNSDTMHTLSFSSDSSEMTPTRSSRLLSGDEQEKDWVSEGKVTPVKNQGSLGTCWAFSAVGVIESQLAIEKNTLVDLSVEQLVECSATENKTSGDADCSEFGGWPYLGFEYISAAGGLYSEKDFPYCSGTIDAYTQLPLCFPCMPRFYDKQYCGDHSDLYCNASSTKGQGSEQLCSLKGDKNKVVSLKEWRKISSDEDEILDTVRNEGPVSVALNALILQFYWKGVINIRFCPTSLDHAVLLVGFGTGETLFLNQPIDFWKVKNSWGETWGEEGYFRIARNRGLCGINLSASIAHIN